MMYLLTSLSADRTLSQKFQDEFVNELFNITTNARRCMNNSFDSQELSLKFISAAHIFAAVVYTKVNFDAIEDKFRFIVRQQLMNIREISHEQLLDFRNDLAYFEQKALEETI